MRALGFAPTADFVIILKISKFDIETPGTVMTYFVAPMEGLFRFPPKRSFNIL